MERSRSSVNSKVTAIINRLPSGSSITSKERENMSSRMARVLWNSQEYQSSNYILSAPRALQSTYTQENQGLRNPLVVGSIIAGVLGVVIIAVLIISVWIWTRLTHNGMTMKERSSGGVSGRAVEHVDADSAVILSSISMSTLDIEEENATQLESLDNSRDNDDTTFYSARDVSIPMEGVSNLNHNDLEYCSESETGIGNEGFRNCEISFKPI